MTEKKESLLVVSYVRCEETQIPAIKGWYTESFLTKAQRIAGFIGADCLTASEGNEQLILLCQVDGNASEVLKCSAFKEETLLHGSVTVTWTMYRARSICTQPGVPDFAHLPTLVATRLYPIKGGEDILRSWLDEDHSTNQLTVPGAYGYYGYESISDDFHFLNMWGLESKSVQSTDAWKAAGMTPRRDEAMQWKARIARGVFTR